MLYSNSESTKTLDTEVDTLLVEVVHFVPLEPITQMPFLP